MSSWIDNEAARIIERDEQIAKSREWSLHAATILLDNRIPQWTSILNQVRSDVEAFNRQFRNDRTRNLEFHEIPSCTLTVHTIPASRFSVTANINGHGSLITITTRETRSNLADQPLERQDWIHLSVDDKSTVVLRHGEERIVNAEEISCVLLKRLVESLIS